MTTVTAPATLTFRLATSTDVHKVRTHVETAFQSPDSRPSWTANMALGRSFTVSDTAILSGITLPAHATLLAHNAANELVASVQVAKRDHKVARIAMLAVRPAEQQSGVGRAVLAHAEWYCVSVWGMKRVGLNVLSTRQKLLSWYVRCGYVPTGKTSPFPLEGLAELGIEGELYFVEMDKVVGGTPRESARWADGVDGLID